MRQVRTDPGHRGSGAKSASASRDRLSRERILAAAQELIDRGGLEQLSMRRLAQELDVWPMGIYRYFHDKDELVEALADSTAKEIPPPDQSRSWDHRLRTLLWQALGLYRRHPGALQSIRVSDAAVAILAEAGLPAAEARRLSRMLLAYTAGSAVLALERTEFEDGLTRLLHGLAA
jgi:AcrR family transcriptional regulator